MVLAILTWFCSIIKWDCDYLSADVSLSENHTGFLEVPVGREDAYYALSTYEDKFHPAEDDDWEYKQYNQDQLDDMGGAFRAARIFALVGMGLIGIPSLVLVAVPCVAYKQYVWKVCATMLVIGSNCEVQTLLFFASDLCKDHNCNFEIGSLPAMASTVLAVVTAVLVLKISQPKEESDPAAREVPSEMAPGADETEKVAENVESA